MGFWGSNTEQDTSTPEERRAWRDRAKAQMAEQKRAERGIPRTPPPASGSQHRPARRPQ